MTIPGVAELLALTLAAEIGEISRSPSARKLVGYAGLGPRVKQSGQARTPAGLSKAGPATLRWAAVESSQHAWRATNPWHRPLHRHQAPPRQGQPGQVRRRAQGPDRLLARPLTQRAVQAERRERNRSCPGKLLHSSGRLTVPKRSEKPGQAAIDHVRSRAPKENSAVAVTHTTPRTQNPRRSFDIRTSFKETSGSLGEATSQPSQSLSSSRAQTITQTRREGGGAQLQAA